MAYQHRPCRPHWPITMVTVALVFRQIFCKRSAIFLVPTSMSAWINRAGPIFTPIGAVEAAARLQRFIPPELAFARTFYGCPCQN